MNVTNNQHEIFFVTTMMGTIIEQLVPRTVRNRKTTSYPQRNDELLHRNLHVQIIITNFAGNKK